MIYDTGEAFWSAPVVDMSESGIFVETVHELAVGTAVTLLPDLKDDETLPFEIRAEVVRTNEYDLDNHFDRTPGIAFRLVDMTPENISQLASFLSARGVKVRAGS